MILFVHNEKAGPGSSSMDNNRQVVKASLLLIAGLASVLYAVWFTRSPDSKVGGSGRSEPSTGTDDTWQSACPAPVKAVPKMRPEEYVDPQIKAMQTLMKHPMAKQTGLTEVLQAKIDSRRQKLQALYEAAKIGVELSQEDRSMLIPYIHAMGLDMSVLSPNYQYKERLDAFCTSLLSRAPPDLSTVLDPHQSRAMALFRGTNKTAGLAKAQQMIREGNLGLIDFIYVLDNPESRDHLVAVPWLWAPESYARTDAPRDDVLSWMSRSFDEWFRGFWESRLTDEEKAFVAAVNHSSQAMRATGFSFFHPRYRRLPDPIMDDAGTALAKISMNLRDIAVVRRTLFPHDAATRHIQTETKETKPVTMDPELLPYLEKQ